MPKTATKTATRKKAAPRKKAVKKAVKKATRKPATKTVTESPAAKEEPQEESKGIPATATNRLEIGKKFQHLFGVQPMWDPMLMWACDELHLNIFAFEDHLKRVYSDLDWNNTAIRDVLKRYYSEEIADFVQSLI